MGFTFWYRWLTTCSILGILCVPLMLWFGIRGDAPQMITDAFWPQGNVPTQLDGLLGWTFGLLGAMWLAFFILILFLVRYPFKAREKWAFWALLIGIGSWFTVDTSFSLFWGFSLNALFNTLYYILLMLPLFYTRKEFKSASGSPCA